MNTKEQWPDLADTGWVSGIHIYVYNNAAILVPPEGHDYDGIDRDTMLDVDELRELARLVTWAADRLDSRGL